MDNNSKKADPGWNDPPMLNYSTSNPPPKSRISNKRVAFPLSSSSTTVLSPKVSSSNVCSSTAHAIEDDSYLEQKTFSNFNVLLESIENDDVLGKIEIMKNMWRTGLLSIDIKKDIHELSDSLVINDCDNANKLHLKLLMNNSTQCNNWISSIQFLINNSQKLNYLDSTK